MNYNKYKDAPPMDTVARIRAIYRDLKLDIRHSVEKRIDGIYSATAIDVNNGWSTSGKGTDEAYCLASAYGESIEHLCSHMAYDKGALPREANAYLEFIRYPDEIQIDIGCIPGYAPVVWKDMLDAYNRVGKPAADEKQVVDFWKRYLGSDKTSFAPYYSVRRRRVVSLPEEIISKLCGSNGGGAGNSAQEAIGHGLDEILERYVKHEIYTKQMTPPEISKEYIRKNYHELFDLIQRIERGYDMKIVVKDASMGVGYTVVSVLMVNQKHQQYMINFGAHPKFEIALERCLTEMFQFYTGKHCEYAHKAMIPWRCEEEGKAEGARNWISLLRDDTGVVPDSYFAGTPSWSFIPWKTYEAYSNHTGMNEQIQGILRNTDKDIYIRNVSFLGFPVYRVYIPELSTSFLPLDERMIECAKACRAISKVIRESMGAGLSTEQAAVLKEFAQDHEYSFGHFIFRNTHEDIIDAFCIALVLDVGSREKAYALLRQKENAFCRCAVKDDELREKGVDERTRNELLVLFFGNEEAEFAACWRKERVFEALMVWNEKMRRSRAPMQAHTMTGDICELHKRVKRKMMENIPDPHSTQALLWEQYDLSQHQI